MRCGDAQRRSSHSSARPYRGRGASRLLTAPGRALENDQSNTHVLIADLNTSWASLIKLGPHTINYLLRAHSVQIDVNYYILIFDWSGGHATEPR